MNVIVRLLVFVLLVGLEGRSELFGEAAVGSSTTSFEVATVRVSEPSSLESAGQWSPPGIGKFWAKKLPLEFLIGMAYGVDPKQQIEGKPGWLGTELYDITAKLVSGVALSREELKPVLQTLLQERFHLAAHRETRMMPGYELVVAKGGPKLSATKGDHVPGFRLNVSPGHLAGLNWSMALLVGFLGPAAGRPVVDRTGIGGSYDVSVEYARDVAQESSQPSLFTALQETLGLKLESRKVPVQMVVIDHVERVPTEN